MGKIVNIHKGRREKVRSVDRELQDRRGSPPTNQAFSFCHLTLKELHLTTVRRGPYGILSGEGPASGTRPGYQHSGREGNAGP